MHAILVRERHKRHVNADIALVCNEGVGVLDYPDRFLRCASGKTGFRRFKQFHRRVRSARIECHSSSD